MSPIKKYDKSKPSLASFVISVDRLGGEYSRPVFVLHMMRVVQWLMWVQTSWATVYGVCVLSKPEDMRVRLNGHSEVSQWWPVHGVRLPSPCVRWTMVHLQRLLVFNFLSATSVDCRLAHTRFVPHLVLCQFIQVWNPIIITQIYFIRAAKCFVFVSFPLKRNKMFLRAFIKKAWGRGGKVCVRGV